MAKGTRSFASKLPADLRAELDRQIVDGRLSVDDLWAWLRDRGVEVGRSSVHRHMRSVEDTAAELRHSRQAAVAIVEQIGPDAAQGKVGQLLIEVVQSIAFKIARQQLTDPEAPALDMEQLMFLTSAVQKLSSANKTETENTLKIREVARKEAAATAGAEAKAMGLDANQVRRIEKAILGVDT